MSEEKPRLHKVSDDKRVDILLREYDTLRNELRQKDASLIQSFSVFVVLTAFVVNSLTQHICIMLTLIALITAVFGAAVFFYFRRPSEEIARWIRDLEETINGLAEAELLAWETVGGWGGAVYDGRRLGRTEALARLRKARAELIAK